MILTTRPARLSNPTKIISLVPSQTELLHYLGLEEETIAITKFCVHPESWFRSKTRIGGTKNLDIEKITKLNPDLIIANKEENIKVQVETLAEKFPVWLTEVNNLQDALQMIDNIGQLTGKAAGALFLIEQIKNKFAALQALAIKTKTAYLIWKNPYMTVGGDTFINSMLEAAGFENIFRKFQRYPEINLEQLRTMNCELVFLSSEPYPFTKTHVDALTTLIPTAKIILVDGEMFSWYGSRLLYAADYFTNLISDLAGKSNLTS